MEWTAREKSDIILRYAMDGVPFCPQDLRPLERVASGAGERSRQGVSMSCPICGRRLDSPSLPLGVALGWMLT